MTPLPNIPLKTEDNKECWIQTIFLCVELAIVLVTVGGGILNMIPATSGLFAQKCGNGFHCEWHPNIPILESKSPAVPGCKILYCPAEIKEQFLNYYNKNANHIPKNFCKACIDAAPHKFGIVTPVPKSRAKKTETWTIPQHTLVSFKV